MSDLTAKVPASELSEGDFVTLPDRDPDLGTREVLATVHRVVRAHAANRVLISWTGLAGGTGTTDLAPDDLVLRVRERAAS